MGGQTLSVDGKVGWGKVSFFVFHAKNAAYSTFCWTKRGGIKNMVLLPCVRAYATLTRTHTPLHIEMELKLIWSIHTIVIPLWTTNELKQIGMFSHTTKFVNLIKPKKTLILLFHQKSIYGYYFGSSDMSMLKYTRGLFVDCSIKEDVIEWAKSDIRFW